MKIRINLTEAKALEDPKKAAADKKAADKKAAEKKAAAKAAAEKKSEEKEKEAKKKAKLKESLRPLIAKMIKENNGFGSSLEEEGLEEDMIGEVDMKLINDVIQALSDAANHGGSSEARGIGKALMAIAGAGAAVPAIQSIVDTAKKRIPRVFKAAEQGEEQGGEPKGAEPKL